LFEAGKILDATRQYLNIILVEFSAPMFERGNCSMLEEIRLYILKEKLITQN